MFSSSSSERRRDGTRQRGDDYDDVRLRMDRNYGRAKADGGECREGQGRNDVWREDGLGLLIMLFCSNLCRHLVLEMEMETAMVMVMVVVMIGIL